MENKAAWLKTKQAKPLEVDDAPMPTPGEREVLIRVRALGFNPVDVGIQEHGIIWDKFPVIIGCDVAGEVAAVGSGVTKFSTGDRVIACTETGAFQRFCVADVALVAKLPASISYTDGCVLPLGITTAASSLFETSTLALPHPQLQQPPVPTGKVVLIWGGSSSVGSCAVQMVKAAGFEVATTASAANFAYCKDLGADYVFDYKHEDVVDEIATTLKQKAWGGVFTAIAAPDVVAKCAQIADRLGGKIVATVMPSAMPYNVPLPEGVRLGYCESTALILPNSIMRSLLGWAAPTEPSQVEPAVWASWLSAALEKGIMKPKPEALVAGKGLEEIQKGLDAVKSGVSAKKVVVEID